MHPVPSGAYPQEKEKTQRLDFCFLILGFPYFWVFLRSAGKFVLGTRTNNRKVHAYALLHLFFPLFETANELSKKLGLLTDASAGLFLHPLFCF